VLLAWVVAGDVPVPLTLDVPPEGCWAPGVPDGEPCGLVVVAVVAVWPPEAPLSAIATGAAKSSARPTIDTAIAARLPCPMQLSRFAPATAIRVRSSCFRTLDHDPATTLLRRMSTSA
jgi:hypothetical protein